MIEYVPTPEDIAELNLAAEKITDEDLKSSPASVYKVAKSITFYKTLTKSDSPDCVDMTLKGISKKGRVLVNLISKSCGYTTEKPDDL